MDTDVASESRQRQRNGTACEACRTAKIRCQPSEQPGVCRKCLSSKIECVSRTGKRTRRPRRLKGELHEARGDPSLSGTPSSSAGTPSGPSATFSINFQIPSQPEFDDSFQALGDIHSGALEAFLPEDSASNPWTMTPSLENSLHTPPYSSSTHSHSIQDLHTRPTFNLSSAESLLASFRSMLIQSPCIVLPADATVAHLASTRPFVLLAILAAASTSRTLQGHSLYDEEFRKVLSLKFVAGGERSVELLQGLIIFCSWYPFHLRPKNRQMFQYMRMAADLVHDLELDQEFPLSVFGPEVTEQQLEEIRTYLSYYYYASAYSLAWKNRRGSSPSFTPWTATCCDILERNSNEAGDSVLLALVRLSRILADASDIMHEHHGQDEYQARLALLGLNSQFKELQAAIPSHVASSPVVQMHLMFIAMYLDGGSLLGLPRVMRRATELGPLPPTTSDLCASVGSLNILLDHLGSLGKDILIRFSAVDWMRFIFAIILGFRLSLPLPECPDFDPSWARSHLRLNEFMDKIMCLGGGDLTPATNKVDILSASRVVLKVVREKYKTAVAKQEAEAALHVNLAASKLHRGCPMLDGSMDAYFPDWDPDYGSALKVGSHASLSSEPIFHDLWATMTMGWASTDESSGGQGCGDVQ